MDKTNQTKTFQSLQRMYYTTWILSILTKSYCTVYVSFSKKAKQNKKNNNRSQTACLIAHGETHFVSRQLSAYCCLRLFIRQKTLISLVALAGSYFLPAHKILKSSGGVSFVSMLFIHCKWHSVGIQCATPNKRKFWESGISSRKDDYSSRKWELRITRGETGRWIKWKCNVPASCRFGIISKRILSYSGAGKWFLSLGGLITQIFWSSQPWDAFGIRPLKFSVIWKLKQYFIPIIII